MASGPVTCLVALGQPWESRVVTALASARSASVRRRCADLPDLVAACVAGLGRVALIGVGLRGLDRSALARIADAGVAVVGVLTDAAAEQERWHQWGVTVLVRADSDTVEIQEAVERALRERVGPGRARGPGKAAAQPDEAVVTSPIGSAPGESPGLVAGQARAGEAGPGGQRTEVALPPGMSPGSVSGGTPGIGEGRIVAVWGPTGAPGRSTVAINLAAELAQLGRSALLVDADPYGGVVAASLGLLDEAPGVLAAVRAAERADLDASALSGLACRVAGGVHVLTGIPHGRRWPELTAAGVGEVLRVGTLVATDVVVDCGFGVEQDEELSYDTWAPSRNAATLTALELADVVLVVGAADPIGLQRLVRALQDLDELPTRGSRLVVVTKVRDSAVGAPAVPRVLRALERFAGVTDVVVIPDDRAGLDRAMLAGRTLAEEVPGSPARVGIQQVAHRLCGVAEPAPSRAWRLPGLRRRAPAAAP